MSNTSQLKITARKNVGISSFENIWTWLLPASLVVLLAALLLLVVPEGAVFGSHTDWLSQHASLAETIRDACLDQKTLLPSTLDLGGGTNGYQFSYYGYLRSDILIGCLLPQVPMIWILIVYMLGIYLTSVLLCYCFLKAEGIHPVLSFIGSVLFMTAGCLFHMHRQIMFVNYLPFLLLAFLCIKKGRTQFLPLCLCLIYLHSFYYSIAALAAVGWYWYQLDGKTFWKKHFLRGYVSSAALSVFMAAALLIPTGLVLLEHRRSGSGFSLLELFGPNPVMNNLLFNEYGMGLTFICFYTILAGLRRREFRRESLLFLLMGIFGIFSYLLNGTLYARPKILIPFMPLLILHCVRFLQKERRAQRFPLWPFAVMLPIGLLWFSQEQFFWIMTDLVLLFSFCIINRLLCRRKLFTAGLYGLTLLLVLIAPAGMYLETAKTEDWVRLSEAETAAGTVFSKTGEGLNPLYRYDSLADPLNSSNELPDVDQPRSSMYSSVTNQGYSSFYYDTLMTPIRINNRVAMLTSNNPFMLNLMGVRYLETSKGRIPSGYSVISDSGGTVTAENKDVLPIAYFTDDVVSEQDYRLLDDYGKLDALTRSTVVDGIPSSERTSPAFGMDSFSPRLSVKGAFPEGLSIKSTADGWDILADRDCSLKLQISNPQPDSILLLQFQVKNQNSRAVVIDINGIRNKLSGRFAPYPNGNDCFHYQFSEDSRTGVNTLNVYFSKGHYEISNLEWHCYEKSFFTKKTYTPLRIDRADERQNGELLSGTVSAASDGYLTTSIPLQRGMEILIDGKQAEIVRVNEAFAGARLTKGSHTVEIRLTPPGKMFGCAVSAGAVLVYILYLAVGPLLKRSSREKT